MISRPFRKDSPARKRPISVQRRNGAAGNMLLLVLIGIALFAALMFVITRENRYDVGATEDAALYAQQITSYAEKINGAVQNVMMQNHCLASQISLANATVSGYTNGANTSCMIFDQTGAGGGMNFQSPPPQAVDNVSFAAAGSPAATQAGKYLFEGNVCVTHSGTGCSASVSELVLVMPWVTKSVCAAIDWITMKSTTIPTIATTTFDGTKFTGTYTNTYTITTNVPTYNPSGTTTYPNGCYYQSTGSDPGTGYHFYYVLVAN